jgi:hypothetical protein
VGGQFIERPLFLHGLPEQARPGVNVLGDDQDVLAQAERVLQVVGAIAVAAERVDAGDHRMIGTGLRAAPPRGVEAEQLALLRPRLDPQLVLVGRLEPAQEGLGGLGPHRPLMRRDDSEDVPDQDLGRDPGCPAADATDQRGEGFRLVERDGGLFHRGQAHGIVSSGPGIKGS